MMGSCKRGPDGMISAQVFRACKAFSGITAKKLAAAMGIDVRSVSNAAQKLGRDGLFYKSGGARATKWHVQSGAREPKDGRGKHPNSRDVHGYNRGKAIARSLAKRFGKPWRPTGEPAIELERCWTNRLILAVDENDDACVNTVRADEARSA